MSKLEKNNKILVLGDLHMKENLSYSQYISDGRVAEKKEILDFIVKQSEDCKHVVLLGDVFNSKNNSSIVNRDATKFIERFEKKNVYIISGNHCKRGDGSTALDFLKEIKNKPNWHVFTKVDYVEVDGLKMSFLPYMLNSELEVETHEEAIKQIMKILNPADILFAHHSISGTMFNGGKVDLLKEVVLPREELEKKFKLVIAGHIHQAQQVGNTIISGNVFTDYVGEIEKFIWKVDEKFEVEKIKVPGRPIYKIENPRESQLVEIPHSSIVKAIITDKKLDIENIKNLLSKFDAYILIEDYPNSRTKAHIEDGAVLDFGIEALLRLYSEEKGVDLSQLLKGLEIINK